MRVSIRQDDPGYNSAVAFNCSILVDGVDVTLRCFTADEEKGIAICYKHNEDGEPYIDLGRMAEETLHGKVEIKFHKYNGVRP